MAGADFRLARLPCRADLAGVADLLHLKAGLAHLARDGQLGALRLQLILIGLDAAADLHHCLAKTLQGCAALKGAVHGGIGRTSGTNATLWNGQAHASCLSGRANPGHRSGAAVVTKLPMPLDEAARLMKRTVCPECEHTRPKLATDPTVHKADTHP